MQINPPSHPESTGSSHKEELASKLPPWLLPGLCFCGGILADFITVGVFKIIWIAIYGTTYLALAMTLETLIARSWGRKEAVRSTISFVIGAIVAHLIFVNHTQYKTYPLYIYAQQPLAFKSAEFPEFLYVTSEPLEKLLKEQNLKENIPMETTSDMDYGCAKNFTIVNIDKIDVNDDDDANWVFRRFELGKFSEREYIPSNENKLLWCRISFYRTN